MSPSDQLTVHFRLTPVQKTALKKLGVVTVYDLLYHFPSRYERAGASAHVRELIPGAKVSMLGTLSKLKAKKLWKSRRTATTGIFEDASGKVNVMWFNQPYIASYYPEGSTVKLTGSVAGTAEKPYLANPQVELVPAGAVSEGLFSDGDAGRPDIFPVYPESKGVTSLWFYHALQRVFESGIVGTIEDPLPDDIRTRYHLPDIATSLIYIHTPEKDSHAEAARKRFSFEEIFTLQTSRARERALNDAQISFPIPDAGLAAERFLTHIPYPPTGAQDRAIKEILSDFTKRQPMARLLEGDVGAGKTLVAAATAYAVVTSRPPERRSGTLQVAYMAPTEILAQQHFRSFIGYFKHLPINIALITGSGAQKFPSKISRDEPTDISRSQLLKWVANGEIAMLIGTHALIQKSVQFQHLAYAIVDEQHRFGTKQRRALAKKGDAAPHFLSMTATPIPRTLALTMYGDLDISVLDELPPGRAKITTKIVKPDARSACYETVRAELKLGRQAYVICPRIDEPDPKKWNAVQAKSAKSEAARLQNDIFPEYEVGLLHGAMKPHEKDAVMESFTRGDITVLVATSVVEVGVNVPNATCILIEGAERFGLAQLHQLRGRVMRSSHPPLCFLLPETKSTISMTRLKALESSSDGFKLAESDLAARGAGDLYGAKQWGVTDIGMEALKNPKLISAAREEARALIAKDPTLSRHAALAKRVASAASEIHGE
ncbi:ATP-dependent DNA helicase RecG [Candidatus Kaiserbacteria bacterium]|nr:ATP-dependent DNA helicase RecG [Candidatus Kaiserbacteria bacterium]